MQSYTVNEYTYSYVSEEGLSRFGEWLDRVDWAPVYAALDPSSKVNEMEKLFDIGVSTCFESKTRTKKSIEPPWMNDEVRDQIKDRREINKRLGRGRVWKELKRKISKVVKKLKRGHNDNLRKKNQKWMQKFLPLCWLNTERM